MESEYLAAGFYGVSGDCRIARNLIAKVKVDIYASAFDKINRNTKLPGSLGVLDTVAVRLADLQQSLEPRLTKKRICVDAGSHGVTSEDVSAYPSDVTGQMVLNFLSGGATINAAAFNLDQRSREICLGVSGMIGGMS